MVLVSLRYIKMVSVRAKSEVDGPSLTWAHNLFVIWAWISYFG